MKRKALDHCWLCSSVAVLIVLLMVIAVKAEVRFIDARISGGHPQLTISNTVPGMVAAIERGDGPLSTNWVAAMAMSTAYTNWTDDSVAAGSWETLVYRGRELPFGSMGDRVWEDLDGNGRQDAGEPGWDGVVVDLTGTDSFGNPVSLMTSTAGGGLYDFSRLQAGTYVATFTRPDGSRFTVQHSAVAGGSNDSDADQATGATSPRMLGEGEDLATVDAGLIVPGSIHGYLFEDLDGNGVDDAEPRKAGVAIDLQGDVDGDGSADSLMTATDANGEYGFAGLHPGSYSVTLTPPGGSVATVPTTFQVTVRSREELVAEAGQAQIPQGDLRVEVVVGPNLAFGIAYLGSVHGYVFEDLNANGIEDAVDPRQAGVTVDLSGVDGQGTQVSLTSVSDANGEYQFTALLPGDYTATLTPPAGAVSTLPTMYQVTVRSREELVAEPGQARIPAGDPRVEVLMAPNLVFGIAILGSVHGYVFDDQNGNGTDDDDPGQSGVPFELGGIDGQGNPVLLTSVSDEQGEFGFTDLLPGTYTVTMTVPPNGIPVLPTAYQVTVRSREELVARVGQAGIPAGDLRVEVLVAPNLVFGVTFLGSIHGFAFHDLNGNGIGDAIDPRLSDRTINLSGTDGQGQSVALQTITDANGEYGFTDLYPGSYTVRIEAAIFAIPSTPTTYSVTVGSRHALVAESGQAGITDPDDPRFEVLQPSPVLTFGFLLF